MLFVLFNSPQPAETIPLYTNIADSYEFYLSKVNVAIMAPEMATWPMAQQYCKFLSGSEIDVNMRLFTDGVVEGLNQ